MLSREQIRKLEAAKKMMGMPPVIPRGVDFVVTELRKEIKAAVEEIWQAVERKNTTSIDRHLATLKKLINYAEIGVQKCTGERQKAYYIVIRNYARSFVRSIERALEPPRPSASTTAQIVRRAAKRGLKVDLQAPRPSEPKDVSAVPTFMTRIREKFQAHSEAQKAKPAKELQPTAKSDDEDKNMPTY